MPTISWLHVAIANISNERLNRSSASFLPTEGWNSLKKKNQDYPYSTGFRLPWVQRAQVQAEMPYQPKKKIRLKVFLQV